MCFKPALFRMWNTLSIALLTCAINGTAIAADEPLNLKAIAEISESTEQIEQSSALEKDPGRSPLAAILRLRAAAEDRDWEQAATYIDTRYLQDEAAQLAPAELIRRLAILWGQQRIIDYSSLSDTESGYLDDGLPSYRDLLGVLQSESGEVPIYIQRVPDGEGGKVWRISNASLQEVPALWAEFGYPSWVERIEKWLPEFSFLAMQNWQVLGLLLMAILLWYLLKVAAWPLHRLPVAQAYQNTWHYFIRYGLRYFLFFKLLAWSVAYLGLSIKAKAIVSPTLLNYLAFLMLGFALIEVFTALYMRSGDRGRFSVSIAKPLATTCKITLVLVMALAWLNGQGFNIGTILAGLGIGSLAVALAAQKTLENVFGAFTLYVARPIKPGDFCRFGDTLGTVEEIGLRSTVIRKLDRTLVYIPNSEFSSKNLENYSSIDRRHYKRYIRLDLRTDANNLKALTEDLLALLKVHSKVLDDELRVRFTKIVDDAFMLEINAYLAVVNIGDFKALAEELNFEILAMLNKHQLQFALPEQKLQLMRGS